MEHKRPMTRSPVELARKAMEIAQEGLPAYSSSYSRRDYTQHQLFALMVLMTFLKTDPRGIVAIVSDWSDVRLALGLSKVPHHTTIYKAQQRLLKKVRSAGSSTPSSATRPVAAWSGTRRRPASTPPGSRPGDARRTTPTEPGRPPT